VTYRWIGRESTDSLLLVRSETDVGAQFYTGFISTLRQADLLIASASLPQGIIVNRGWRWRARVSVSSINETRPSRVQSGLCMPRLVSGQKRGSPEKAVSVHCKLDTVFLVPGVPENKFGKPTTDQLDFRHVYQSNEVLLESQWDLGLISTLPEVRLEIPVFAL